MILILQLELLNDFLISIFLDWMMEVEAQEANDNYRQLDSLQQQHSEECLFFFLLLALSHTTLSLDSCQGQQDIHQSVVQNQQVDPSDFLSIWFLDSFSSLTSRSSFTLLLHSLSLSFQFPKPLIQSGMEPFHISDLASEILLFIFFHLDLIRLVICKRVNKQFQEVIDNNQLLWGAFEWIEQDQESFRPALDMVDRKSRSSLEQVSIQEQNSEEEDLLHLMQVLGQSKETLREVNLKVSAVKGIESQMVELVTAGRRLRRLIVWEWGWELERAKFPLSRLSPSNSKVQKSFPGQLQLLWVEDGVRKVDLNSLVSFAQGEPLKPQNFLELTSSFSETVLHLRLGMYESGSAVEPLFCPNLKIFEGWVGGLFPYLDAPRLKTIVMKQVVRFDLELLPSVEEIWLQSRNDSLALAGYWEPLLRLCPKLRILKLTENCALGDSSVGSFVFTGILEMLRIRYLMSRDGEEIDGIKVVRLEKLILPTSMLKEEELKVAAKIAKKLIDVEDHKELIGIEYRSR